MNARARGHARRASSTSTHATGGTTSDVTEDLDPPRDTPLEETERERRSLTELLNEARILLPGAQVFLAFLFVLPFSPGFEKLSAMQKTVFLFTFLADLLALACFTVPAVYHRIARPIHDKERFKVFATKLIVLGLVPFSISIVLATYLVCSVVSPAIATACAIFVAAVIIALWWIAPLVRVHERFTPAP